MTNSTPDDRSRDRTVHKVERAKIVTVLIVGITVLALPFLFGNLDLVDVRAAIWPGIWVVCFPIYVIGRLLRVANHTEPIHPSGKVHIFLAMFMTVTSSIAFSACEYAYFGLRDTSIQLDPAHDGVVHDAVKSLYFSVVTWTTLGYGDFVPANGITRFFAAWEALTGYVVMAVLISALVSTFRSPALKERALKEGERGPER
jgi:hypothetical protein